jgi:hypothetical protein
VPSSGAAVFGLDYLEVRFGKGLNENEVVLGEQAASVSRLKPSTLVGGNIGFNKRDLILCVIWPITSTFSLYGGNIPVVIFAESLIDIE